MAVLDAAMRRLQLGDGPTAVHAVPIAASLGVGTATRGDRASAEPPAESRRLSAKALTAILLGGWGIIVIIANNRPHPRGDNHSELVIGSAMAGIALVCGLWATADTLRGTRLRNVVLALLGLATACVSAGLGITALGG